MILRGPDHAGDPVGRLWLDGIYYMIVRVLYEIWHSLGVFVDHTLNSTPGRVDRGGLVMNAEDDQLFVVFGGTGDLMQRKLLPALYRLSTGSEEVGRTQVLGVARSTDFDDASYQQWAVEILREAGLNHSNLEGWCEEHLGFQSIRNSETEDYQRLADRIRSVEEEKGLPGNRVFYLGLPPKAFSLVIDRIGEIDLHESPGWTRLVVEKPIGRDLSSVQELNSLVHRYFDESQIYRIDHYLGKETVRNLLVYRFGNTVFESLWNRHFIDNVQITVAEDLGVGTRTEYYDRSGALRDMVQNHLTQLLTLTAMEPPSSFDPAPIRNEKIKVLKSIKPLSNENVIFGQYTSGEMNGSPVRGYHEEQGVPEDSTTETFVALKMEMDNWRWQGVPFYLRTGKRLPKKCTEIAVVFQRPPGSVFDDIDQDITQDVLRIVLQPDEGFSLYFDLKTPGKSFNLSTMPLDFRYADEFEPLPDAYETLLLDMMKGDQTLFVRADEVEASWALYTPLLENSPETRPYAAGTWGPSEADWLLQQSDHAWRIFQG